ncbi:type II toxin-antitoxin system death-on-curing family toxin [Sphingomonas naphthae]|uniref:Type II toxin-antitoxin system death-on-curing family toxin n=1 Tax=Sphingomonas naphthae TaxID=1813468 RepID=A0ABY7TKY3_9SPHN|nr:type II toxin-antitoxin system death-on-curing family toxin [Sphingomonas naphthae]WCT72519.1 type II toxin-antitoxin system death-on-curing family toxin [Sphingomonas naphthae]
MSAPQRAEPIWLDLREIVVIHDRQLAEHGGGSGIRDRNLLESALARPRNSWAYGESDWAALAADYAYGFARNHGFVDGNKRIAWIAARLFLALNGQKLAFDKADAIRLMLSLAAGEIGEDALAAWFRERLTGD